MPGRNGCLGIKKDLGCFVQFYFQRTSREEQVSYESKFPVVFQQIVFIASSWLQVVTSGSCCWMTRVFHSQDFEHRGVLDLDQFLGSWAATPTTCKAAGFASVPLHFHCRGWTFAMHNNYHSNIRRRFHKVLNETQVQELLGGKFEEKEERKNTIKMNNLYIYIYNDNKMNKEKKKQIV